MDKLVLHALEVRQPIGTFFLCSIAARDLVAISYSDVRRLAHDERDVERYLGIQRPVSKRRIKEIKKYIQSPDATFPTAVIVAVDDRCAEYDADTQTLTLAPVPGDEDLNEEPIPIHKIARVIDGQHRIASFMDENGDWCFGTNGDHFDVNLAVFVGLDIPEQANIFATVNLAQTKVNRSLVYDLTELAKKRSPYKSCHDVAVALDREKRSPLYQRIKMLGTATPGRVKEPLTQAAFVEELVEFLSEDPVQDRNDLFEGKRLKKAIGEELRKRPFRNLWIEKKDVDIAEILFNYFCAVRGKWPNAWAEKEKTGNLLPRSNAFKALMKFLREDVYLDIVGDDIGTIPPVSKFSMPFKKLDLGDDDFTTKKFPPGSGGQSSFLKMLRGEIGRDDMLDKS